MNKYLNQLRADNEIIFRTLKWLNQVYAMVGDFTHESYYAKQKFLQNVTHVKLPNTTAAALRMILSDAKIEKIKENIYKIKNPNVDINMVSPEDIESMDLFDLTDTELVNYFALYSRSITINEQGNLLLLKYSPVIYETGWSKLSLLCRGKVIDMETETIVSYPYDKFFNINEREDYRDSYIAELMNNARSIYVTDKKDGSLVAVTKQANGEMLITTNGSFDNMHINLARKMLAEKYPTFLNNIAPGRTYIFEIIHPEDKHCISYGDTEKMYLHGVRDLSTLALLDYEDLENIAYTLNLDLIEREYLSLDSMQKKVHDKNANKEGWVVRIVDYDGSEKIVKIKYDEYFVIHRLRCGVNIKKVYNHYVFVQDIQDMLPLMLPDIKEATLSVIEEINISRQKIAKRAIEVAKQISEIANVNLNHEFTREEKKSFYVASQSLKNTHDWPFVPLAIKYASFGSIDWDIAHLRYERYSEMNDLVEN